MCQLLGMNCNIPTDIVFSFTGFATRGGLTDEIAAYGVFNMMLSDGAALYAYCSTKLHYIVRQYPFAQAMLSDEDLSVDFSEVTTPNDRVAIIVTEPLTTNENWQAFSCGELKVFIDGMPVTSALAGSGQIGS